MEEEGAGPKSPFFPSSGETTTGNTVPEDFFLDSQACQRCHADIYSQWESSMHHFSSFNNQWYRQAIVYMQGTIGVQPSKWCAGCHDAALFFPGNFNTPIAPRVHTPPAQAGIGCMVCHSLVKIKSTMGNGDYMLKYPALSKLVRRKNPVPRRVIDFLIEEDPEPHRRTFLKPFMRTQTGRFLLRLPQGSSGCAGKRLSVGRADSTITTTGRPAASPGLARDRFTIRRSRRTARLPHAGGRLRRCS